ncbi:sensor domain-containing diguanylate cyclase [Rossellomorea aquimaris]|uniref:sensor domain-containing diguanylate cyclase n=1 Tax=Rossellomorea aquimaris TaxID=189382 RepID=UPI001CD67A61|nr:sensor domain-containing diguanylate cyclase [Rossellomorea aquimaris]MCA1056329.1 sensor domain-containing diguanylate cyclase [Rossellomorea aquimaris]
MQLSRRKKFTLLYAWLAVVPAGLYFTYQFYPPQNVAGHGWELLALILFAALIPLMPIVINGATIFFIQWVTLVGFLKYGLFVEIVLMQFSIIPLLFRIKVSKSDWHRIPLNSLMFFLVSVSSGLVYFLVGGEIGAEKIGDILPAALSYQVASIMINAYLLLAYQRYFVVSETRFYTKDFIWDFISNMIMFPMSLSLYFLTFQIGPYASLLIGIPFISLSLMLKMYNSSEKINEYLQKAGEIGHQLTESLKVDEVLDIFLEKIIETLPVEHAYILDCKGDELVLLRRVESKGKDLDRFPVLKKGKGISGRVWKSGRSVIYDSRSEWATLADGYMPPGVESILCVPIVRSQKVRGILLLASSKKRAYEKFQLMIVEILCSYFGVAIENARHHEKTKKNSERCALTNLYNYRYFEDMLSLEFNELERGGRTSLSLIMLDLDHFKVINDNYGHQSGNEILVELADRLCKLIGSKGTVARYGGEEFVILLPDTERPEAMMLAERVRKAIANRPFVLHDSLQASNRKLMVRITASIGVSSAPEDADDTMTLIRHADRALYTGAKQAGRNRVAKYVK